MHGAALGVAAIGLSLASFMQILDQTIANVSLPTIAGNLGVSPNQGTWVITSFGVATAISLPLTGWLAQRIGQVRLLRWSTLLFVLASVLCGTSTSLEMLVAARILQGAVAGPDDSVVAGDAAGGLSAGAARLRLIALVDGGDRRADLRAAPRRMDLGELGLALDLFHQRSGRPHRRGADDESFQRPGDRDAYAPIDATGLVLLALWVGSLQIMLDTGADAGWFDSGEVILFAVVAFVGLCYFIVWELTDAHPVVDLRLFARRNFLVGVAATSVGFMMFFGISIVVPLWLQTQMGYTAAWAGLAVAPVSFFPLVLSRSIARWLQRSDPRIFASGALVLAGASFMRAAFTTQVDFSSVVLAQLVTGLGIALFMVPLQSISLSGLRNDQMAGAAGLSSFFRVIGGSFGASLAITLWSRREALHRTQLSESISAWDPRDVESLARIAERGARITDLFDSGAHAEQPVAPAGGH